MCIFETTVEMYSEGGSEQTEVQQCALAGDELYVLFVNEFIYFAPFLLFSYSHPTPPLHPLQSWNRHLTDFCKAWHIMLP